MAEQKKKRKKTYEAEEQRLAKMKAPPQLRLDLLLPSEDAGDGDLLFGISLDVVEATPGQAEAR